MGFVKRKMKEYSGKGLIKPSSPMMPGKFGISFGTYAGPHIGEREALPMTFWLNSFLGHLGYTVIDQWHVVGKHHHNKENNKCGRLGNIENRPDKSDLFAIGNKVDGIVKSISKMYCKKCCEVINEKK